MTRVRIRRALTALALLAWQLVASVAPPVVFGYANAQGAEEMLCTCPDMPGATCPMHHGRPHEEEQDDRSGPRWCSTCPDLDRVVLSLMTSALGAPIGTFHLFASYGPSLDLLPRDARALAADDPPCSPPPRR